MNRAPTQNDSENPLVSILIYNYETRYLRQCLQAVCEQQTLPNIEVVLLDDASTDGAWDVALEFARNYPELLTIQRNRAVAGPQANLQTCLKLAKARYCVTLSRDWAFLPDYFARCVATLRTDPLAHFDTVHRTAAPYAPPPSVMERPLVSLLCYNYNYGRYLRQCLDSAFGQTYPNIEVCFSDNASTDDSWDIALEFAQRYPGRMHMTRNRKNFGPDANFANCYRMLKGKYFVNLCSDDALAPEFVERCVTALEAYPNAGFALVNRAIIDEHGNRTEELPFYNQSCIIPGEGQAAVYMMAGVNPSVSQIMYPRSVVDGRSATGGLVSRYYGTRIMDFNISIDFDVAYIQDSLLLHRIHSQSDTTQADANLLPVIGLYVLNHQLADIASVRGLNKVVERLPASLEKLARLSLRYTVRSLIQGREEVALRYFHLATAIVAGTSLANDDTWKQLREYWDADATMRKELLVRFARSDNLAARSVSYDPPPDSIPLRFGPPLAPDRARIGS